MIWIAPSEKDTATETLEKRLWDAADRLRANSGLKAQEYSGPILGLIFLRFAEVIEPYHGGTLETLPLANSRCINRGMKRVKSHGVHGKTWPRADWSIGPRC